MKIFKLLVLGLVFSGLATAASAQSLQSLERDLNNLKEDVKLMQRQYYKEEANSSTPQNSKEMMVKVGQMDETVRKMKGQMDELDYKIKKLNERIDLLNKDIDVRIKMIEGKPVEGMGTAGKPQAKTFDAPVAVGAPAAIAGGAIAGGDLAPLEGEKKKQSINDIYQRGLEELKAGKFEEAEQSFTMILTEYVKDKLAGNAQYWLGEVYYGKGDYERAAVAFARGYQEYKTSAKGADSLLKLGMSMKALKKNKEACAAFQSLPKEFPKATDALKDKAKKEAAALKCK
ncbi:MAG: tol-pal system protein YbgF [Lactobacillus sp.]|jgi:tol-pal system protein YbgF|nr:tol-pal system protein YbgF [Lactobacillus sp.]